MCLNIGWMSLWWRNGHRGGINKATQMQIITKKHKDRSQGQKLEQKVCDVIYRPPLTIIFTNARNKLTHFIHLNSQDYPLEAYWTDIWSSNNAIKSKYVII